LPNSVVSQSMTVSRSAPMFSTASCIGQLAWLHIKRKPQALSDLQAFDDASRGPAGAASMLAFPTRYRFPAMIGSLITIATLLMEPFTQQVLQFPLHSLTIKDTASYPITQFYAPVPNAALSMFHKKVLVHDCIIDICRSQPKYRRTRRQPQRKHPSSDHQRYLRQSHG
jgi:hypothetical protein